MSIAASRVCAILLAAGAGRRFGGDKLGAMLGCRPLIEHAAEPLRTLAFARLIAVVPPGRPMLAPQHFQPVEVTDSPALSRSLAAGIALATEIDCDAALVALADMPQVPASHFAALLYAHDGDVTASSDGASASPPAIFARARFAELLALTGDAGARSLLHDAKRVLCDASALADVDHREDLARLARHARRGEPIASPAPRSSGTPSRRPASAAPPPGRRPE